MIRAYVMAAAGLLDGQHPVGGFPVQVPEDFPPRNVRRRLSRLIDQALRVTWAASDPSEDIPLVFGTANGEIETIAALLPEVLRPDPSLSPTAFHNSVHNAAPGYWAILARRVAASTTVTAGPRTFEASLLEAALRLCDGAPQVQVTVGDEAIRTASWADPQHCPRDFCGSLRLALRPPPGGRPLAVLESLTFGVEAEEPPGLHGETLLARDVDRLADGTPHPDAALATLLEFFGDRGGPGRLHLRRTFPGGARFQAVFVRGDDG